MAAHDTYAVRNCTTCARNNLKYRQRRNLQLFFVGKPLEFVIMYIVRPFQKTLRVSNRYIIVELNCFSQLTRAVPTLTTTATHAANMLTDYWLICYTIPTYHLTRNRSQFVSIFPELVCILLGVRHLATMAYHPQTNC